MNISTLERYVESKNQWRAMFGNAPWSLLNSTDRQRIAETIEAELSPENLTCDGELSATQVRRRYQMLHRAAQELVSIDPNVQFYDYA